MTHYHGDHYGATPEISHNMHIVNWVDHGPNVEHDKDVPWQKHWVIKCNEVLYSEYLRAQKDSKHIVVKPGDKFEVDGMNIRLLDRIRNGRQLAGGCRCSVSRVDSKVLDR